MTTAIFEILGLLTVSCLIGIFFTRRYWKAKLKSSTETEARLKEELNKARQIKPEIIEKVVEVEKEVPKEKNKTSGTETKKLKELKNQIELMEEQLDEKEREIEVLGQELAARKISYYKQIDGKRYKAITLKMAEEAVAGKGDGRISMEDAKKIFETISDGKSYTQVEKDTMRYLRDHFHWTDSADELFRKKVRSWAAKGHEF